TLDVRSGKQLRSFPGHFGALSRDGTMLATWSSWFEGVDRWNYGTHLWDRRSGERLGWFQGATPVFSADGKRVAVGGRLWDVSSKKPKLLKQFTGGWAFHPETRIVAAFGSRSKDGLSTIRLFDGNNGKELATLNPRVVPFVPVGMLAGQVQPSS